MALVQTRKNEIDRKLHTIVLQADPEKFDTQFTLAESIAKQAKVEFSYQATEGTRHAGPHTVSVYVGFASHIGLLDENYALTRAKSDVRQLENFQLWLADRVMDYLNEHNASTARITQVIDQMLAKRPCELPTAEALRRALGAPLSLMELRFCLKLVSLLRPKAVRIKSYRLYYTLQALK